MIIEMPNTKTSDIARKVTELHEQRGEAGNDRVLSLIIATDETQLEGALDVANAVSREHPCRVIAVVPQNERETESSANEPNEAGEVVFAASGDKAECVAVDANDKATDLDAQVRFGSDAGAGEVIILRPKGGLVDHADTLVIPLLVPDIPIVTWWPTNPPQNPAEDRLGAMANKRITDALRSDDPEGTIERLRANWTTADVDLSWTRVTIWRAMLASMVDQPPHLPVQSVKVTGQADYLPLDMLASWLGLQLDVPVQIAADGDADAITGVYLTREDGVLSLERPARDQAVISQPGQTPQPVSMPKRTLEDCLSEELRRLDPDEIYAEVVRQGWKR